MRNAAIFSATLSKTLSMNIQAFISMGTGFECNLLTCPPPPLPDWLKIQQTDTGTQGGGGLRLAQIDT